MRKRWLPLLLALALLLSLTVAAASSEVRLGAVSAVSGARAGEQFTVNVEIEDNPGFNTFHCALTFDPEEMECLAVDAGADLVVGHHSHRMNPIEQYKGVYICYSLGNFCFAGNSKPSDMSSFVFQTRFRVKDGVCTPRGFRIIPIRISSRSSRNDFIPTPYTAGSNTDSVLTTLRSNGRKLEYAVPDYPLEWK